jgi:hypothetical protein
MHNDIGLELSQCDLRGRKRDVFLILRKKDVRQRRRAGYAAMSLGFGVTELLASIQNLERLTKERLAVHRKRAETPDVRAQLLRYGVCICSCHFSEHTTHTGEACCGNARVTS